MHRTSDPVVLKPIATFTTQLRLSEHNKRGQGNCENQGSRKFAVRSHLLEMSEKIDQWSLIHTAA